MSNVLQFTKRLVERPAVATSADIKVRNYRGPEDMAPWLELRQRAFARQKLGVRQWDEGDFERELTSKPWWLPERMWFAEPIGSFPGLRIVGSVALSERGPGQPAVHWLMVDPRWRRRGVGRLLMTTLEAHCWDAGARQICLETHLAWTAAVVLYERMGYERTPSRV